MRHFPALRSLSALVWGSIGFAALAGCTPDPEPRAVGSSNLAGGPNLGSGGGGERASQGGAAPIDCAATTSVAPALAGRVRRLTRLELESTLTDLLGEQAGTLAKALEPDASSTKFSTGADRGVSANYVSDLSRMAELAAASLSNAAESQALTSDCTHDDENAAACARRFIQSFAARAFRRPVTDAEVDELFVIYGAGKATAADDQPGSALQAGLEYVVRAVLQAPSFIFRTELGASDAERTPASLTPFEAAAVLSYGLIGSPPDEELRQQAAIGALATAEQITAQGRRLLQAHPDRYARQMDRFVREWLGIDLGTPGWRKDPALYPHADASFKTALDRETSLFVSEWSKSSSFVELLTVPRGFVSAKNAWVYDADGVTLPSSSGDELGPLGLDPSKRSGILTLPSFLGSQAHEAASSPVLRGVTILRKFLCLEPPPVPAVIPPLPPATSGSAQTTRARYQQHLSAAACSGCHSAFEAMGDAFEHYDAVGHYRDQENGAPVDSSGALEDGPNIEEPVRDAVELGAKLARNDDVHACFVRQAYRFTFGRNESDAEACALAASAKVFADANSNVAELLLDLVVRLATSPRTPSPREP